MKMDNNEQTGKIKIEIYFPPGIIVLMVDKVHQLEVPQPMINQVDIRAVKRDLMRAPRALVMKFQKWVDDIEKDGLEEVRKVRGWHDHTLKGGRAGQGYIPE